MHKRPDNLKGFGKSRHQGKPSISHTSFLTQRLELLRETTKILSVPGKKFFAALTKNIFWFDDWEARKRPPTQGKPPIVQQIGADSLGGSGGDCYRRLQSCDGFSMGGGQDNG